jgi:hypothetical protein
VEAEAHDQGREQQTVKCRQKAGRRGADSEKEDGQSGQSVLADDQHEIDGQQGEKAGNFPDRLQDAYMPPLQTDHFHGEVVEQDHPGLQADNRCSGEDDEETEHRFLFVTDHDSFPAGGIGYNEIAVSSGPLLQPAGEYTLFVCPGSIFFSFVVQSPGISSDQDSIPILISKVMGSNSANQPQEISHRSRNRNWYRNRKSLQPGCLTTFIFCPLPLASDFWYC